MPSKGKGKVEVPQKKAPTEIEKKKQALKAEKAKVEKKCYEEFQAVLKKHKCDIIISCSTYGKNVKYGIHFVMID